MIFNSRDEFYKKPIGPIENNSCVTFKIHVPENYVTSEAYLCIAKDREEFVEIQMYRDGNLEYCDIFEITYNADMGVSPYWYHFKLNTTYGLKYVSKSFGGEGVVCDEPYSFQQTVYDENYKIPKWFSEGIMYNIFPDRFNRTNLPKPHADRVVHENWDDVPVYLPNEDGEILNNDFFGGNLQGIIQKLDYLKSLNVTVLYLNPIFKAYSNHRYDTGDYKSIDEYLGTERDFKLLCKRAKERGIRIILDGVFSHTGFDSLYFNGKNTYDSIGAYNSKESPYYDWFTFEKWNKKYAAWWGIYTLPEVNEMNEKYLSYIIDDKKSVINKWIELGASGYRLDVADELPDEFIYKLNVAAKNKDSEAFIIGEVWEDASNKESYSDRRKYVYGQYLDSVMNYPLKDAVLDYMKYGHAENFKEAIENMKENYPTDFFNSLMNVVGTHDTARILTTLVGEPFETKTERANARLSSSQKELGMALLRLTTLIQYTMPGCPCIYYGDEVGMEGYEDPLNRRTYPWGKEDTEVLEWYKKLGEFRSNNLCILKGEIKFLYARGNILVYSREYKDQKLCLFINNSNLSQDVYIHHTRYMLKPYDYKIINLTETAVNI